MTAGTGGGPGLTARRTGRLPAAEREQRRREVVTAAMEVLVERGYERMTVQDVAVRASASKETIYSWFGGREGLLAAVVESNADASSARVAAALQVLPTTPQEVLAVLTAYAAALLRLLTGPQSVALNRAAVGSPALAAVLLASGRHRSGPVVEDFIGRLHASGMLRAPDPAEAFRVLYGLAVRDTQIRVLLGEAPPPPAQVAATAAVAVDAFLTLHRP